MARTQQQDDAEAWSCPLCTLLNTAEDDKCAACDNVRPPTPELQKSQPSEPSTVVVTASAVQHVDRPSSGSMVTMEDKEERQEAEDTAMDVDEPCFNLLGSGAAIFAAPSMHEAIEEYVTDETKSRDGSENEDDEVVAVSPRYPGFMPASKVLVEEPKIEQKLASAGLSLSDSEDEEKPKQLRRRTDERDDSWEDKWMTKSQAIISSICLLARQTASLATLLMMELLNSSCANLYYRQCGSSVLENPYADLSQYNDYAANEVADADPDFVEEISDNEVRRIVHDVYTLIINFVMLINYLATFDVINQPTPITSLINHTLIASSPDKRNRGSENELLMRAIQQVEGPLVASQLEAAGNGKRGLDHDEYKLGDSVGCGGCSFCEWCKSSYEEDKENGDSNTSG
ncbi:hypothetical protein PHMEG_0009436 [Phytophthora megakarya]|uniref:RanBP2-type domain-containing protein n=1 Tax=Phytophthora megakarya TaxID=4795 RepID=A0A225WG87_9STRA|nr:hypothetical protein PHMEG_0009436 [Phytophthora megakarya]